MSVQTWASRGDCRDSDPEAWFDNVKNYPMLREICASCPVLELCREYAVIHEEYGFWGGLTERQRRKIRRGKDLNEVFLPALKAGRVHEVNLIDRDTYKEALQMTKGPTSREKSDPLSAEQMSQLNDLLSTEFTFEPF